MKGYWTSSTGRIELVIPPEMAICASHPGQCDADVLALSKVACVEGQLRALNTSLIREELRGYGAWDDEELADDAQNLQRLLWIACGDINDECAA
jgi:hypothetical protein